MNGTDIAIAFAVAVMLGGASAVALSRDVIRMTVAFGVFLVGVALAFLALGSPLLAVAQVFLYVGGILVLVLFALMVAGRASDERPVVEARHDLASAGVALAVFGTLTYLMAPVAREVSGGPANAEAIAEWLLGPGVIAFELAGVVLLAALLAVLVIVQGGDRS